MGAPEAVQAAARREPNLRPVVVIGKRTLTAIETDCLETMGYCWAMLGKEVHVPDAPGAPRAVARGAAQFADAVHMHRANLSAIEGDVVAVLDDEIRSALTKTLPDWAERDWVQLNTEAEIIHYTELMLAVLSEQGWAMTAQ